MIHYLLELLFGRLLSLQSETPDSRLNFNVFVILPCNNEHQVSLCHLEVLSLKHCKLRRLDDDMAEMLCLKELYLESNLILSLPQAFTRLRSLEVDFNRF